VELKRMNKMLGELELNKIHCGDCLWV
jgi:hypothetical protein